MIEQKKVLILGGGFGGIKSALELEQDSNMEITLISDQKHFRYYPALYRTATGKSSRASSIPLSEIFKDKRVKVIQDSAVEIDRKSKNVSGQSGKTYNFDILIVALGVVTNFFGIKGLREYAFGIKSLEESQELRDHLHKLLIEKKKPDINYVVIGGGPTGVELAGALPSYINHIMQKHGLEDRPVHVDLVEAAPRLVPKMNEKYSKRIAKHLQKIGVTLFLNQRVMAETSSQLVLADHPIASHSVVWTAGVTNHPFLKANNFNLDNHGKVTVNEYLESEQDIYVIGDNASTPFSGMAQTALYDANYVAKQIKNLANGNVRQTYKPKEPIYITPAGPGWAAVKWGRFNIFGWPAWILRRLADFVAYHDFEPWQKASKHWLADGIYEENCRVCRKN
jgi:NADH dehydrogenase